MQNQINFSLQNQAPMIPLQRNQDKQNANSHLSDILLEGERSTHPDILQTHDGICILPKPSWPSPNIQEGATSKLEIREDKLIDAGTASKKIRFVDNDEDKRMHNNIQKEPSMLNSNRIRRISRSTSMKIEEDEETLFIPVAGNKHEDNSLNLFTSEPEFSIPSPNFLQASKDDNSALDDNSKMHINGDQLDQARGSQGQKKRLKKLTNINAEKKNDDAGKNSDTQSKDLCSVCLSAFINATGHIDSCKHIFCYTCIVDWAKVTNECPICRTRFNQITKFSKTGKKLSSMPVEFKVQNQSDDSEDSDEADFEEEIEDTCYICNEGGQLIVCDSCGIYCCHPRCYNPNLRRDSIDEWICTFCESEELELSRQARVSNTEDPYRLRLARHRDPSQRTLLEQLFERVEANSRRGGDRSFEMIDEIEGDSVIVRQTTTIISRRNANSRNNTTNSSRQSTRTNNTRIGGNNRSGRRRRGSTNSRRQSNSSTRQRQPSQRNQRRRN